MSEVNYKLTSMSNSTRLQVGESVKVGDHTLEREAEGFAGRLLGFTITHGWACVCNADGKRILVHPESLVPHVP